jgi:hypothetical protein
VKIADGAVEGVCVGHCNKNYFSEINRTKEWKPILIYIFELSSASRRYKVWL